MTSITRSIYTAEISGLPSGDLTLDVKSVEDLTLDEQQVPYGRVRITAALPAQAELEEIDPYSSQRLQLSVNHSWQFPTRSPQTRTFDFLLHERRIDHAAGTLTLIGQTDEAMLLDYRLIAGASERTYGLSVKTAVEYALAKVGATLEPGAADANLLSETLKPTITNLYVNPSAETNLTSAAGINSTLTRDTGYGAFGTCSFRVAATGTADSHFNVGGDAGGLRNGMVAGQTYTISATARLTAALTGSEVAGGRSRRIVVFHRIGAAAHTEVASVPLANVAGSARLSVTFALPAGTTDAFIRFYNGFTAGSIWWDGLLLTAGAAQTPYFDGSTTGGNEAGLYSVAWSGTAHASTSTLTNLANSDATIWKPGNSADDFLAPILQAGGLRLFCDEQRKWRLVDSDYLTAGVLYVSEGFNATSGTDLMSRQFSEDGRPLWFDGVVVRYFWTDGTGVQREAFDFASTGSVKGHFVEFNRPYPGPGAAAAILGRAAGRGRTQEIVSLVDYTATPGMALVSTLPGTPIQSGVLSSVTWQWSETEDAMQIGSRGLTETPVGAWVLALGAWSAATGTWAAATGTN